MDAEPSLLSIDRTDVLGIPVDLVDMKACLRSVQQMVAGDRANIIAAVNPEKVMAAQRNSDLLRALRDASLVIPDGIGVVLAARVLGRGHIERVAGSDLMPAICQLAAREGYKVFLYGAKPDVIERAAHLLQTRFSGLTIAGIQHGYVAEGDMTKLIDSINHSGADILFVGLGSPRQELWMHRYQQRLSVRVCQGVGGSFDAICGNPRRAPLVFRKLYLEWFYRLITQPNRAQRQLALPRFLVQVLRQAIAKK